jgi:hypothetical protein
MTLLTGGAVRRATGFGADVDPSRATAVLATVRAMLGLADSELDSVPELEHGR